MSDVAPGKNRKGRLFIISAPSGAGKTTLCDVLKQRFPELAYSISHTTRPPRKNEAEGEDYFFISEEIFLKKIQTGKWAEWAKVHGNYYGTCLEKLNELKNAGRNILLDIDVAGAMQIKKKFSEAITIFIMPPSFDILEKRLKSRGTDDEEEIQRRLGHAREEIAHKDHYDHIIINDRLDEAIERLSELVKNYIVY
jgi:guanylate kinase